MGFLRAAKKFLVWIGDAIGSVMTLVLLTVLYFTVIFVVWVISKLFGKKFLETDILDGTDTYWLDFEGGSKPTLDKLKLPY